MCFTSILLTVKILKSLNLTNKPTNRQLKGRETIKTCLFCIGMKSFRVLKSPN
jgi:hypothetical protein